MFARTYMPSFVQVACASSSIESFLNGSSIGIKPSTRKNEKLHYHEGIITLLKMVIAMVE
jgi:aminopeptidase C